MVHKLEIGVPFKPMLVAESGNGEGRYKDIIERHGVSQTEIKSDGYRVQVHKRDDVSLFTRNLNPLDPNIFPDLAAQFSDLPRGVYDGELVGISDGIIGFNAVKRRIRGSLDKRLVGDFPLKINFFDVLNLEGRDVFGESLSRRRGLLEQYVECVTDLEMVSTPEQLQGRFERLTREGYEGLVCKDPDSTYSFGGRTKDWIKLKKFLSLDLVVLGLYRGEGKLENLPFAALLLGTRRGDTYETLTKVGLTNPKKVSLLYERVRGHCVPAVPINVFVSDKINQATYARKVPFTYVAPESSAVVEVEAVNITRSRNWHSCGYDSETREAYSLRIPVVRELRFDKTPKDSATTGLVCDLYNIS